MNKLEFKRFNYSADQIGVLSLNERYVQCVPGIGKTQDANFAGQRVLYAPNPLPCVTIFVHGVNSEGEWYDAAEALLCRGLNDRLGRWGTPAELKAAAPTRNPKYTYAPTSPLDSNRPKFDVNGDAEDDEYVVSKSPIIRFYWGYKARKGDMRRPSHHDIGAPASTDEAHRRQFPVALDNDDAWGGGPFQNGTSSLAAMFRKDKGFTSDYQALNPITDRFLTIAPPRTYFVHAARRLAFLIETIRKNSPQETINVVSHSQGTMVASLAMLILKDKGVRGPEALFLCNSPYSLNEPSRLESVQYGNDFVPSRSARFRTLKAVADVIKNAGEDPKATTDAELARYRLSKPDCRQWAQRDEYGRLYIYADPHDRVMGASVLRSIGWRALSPSEQSVLGASNVKVRMFAENIEPARGDYVYTMSARAFGITKDDDNKETGRVRASFWFPSSEKIVGVKALYDDPKPEEATISINAPSLPLADKAFRKKLTDDGVWPELKQWSGRLKDFDGFKSYLDPAVGGDARDVNAYAQVYNPNSQIKPSHGRRPQSNDYSQTPDYTTVHEAMAELEATQHNSTDHSAVPSNSIIVRGVMAWDLALGLNQSYCDVRYWRYLKTLADWKLSDPYFLENDEGALPEPGPMPSGVDKTLAFPTEAADAVQY